MAPTHLIYYLIFILIPLNIPWVYAESVSNTETQQAIISEKIERIKSNPTLNNDLKVGILNSYFSAEDDLEETRLIEQKIKQLQLQITEIPKQIKAYSQQIVELESNAILKPKTDIEYNTLEELEQQLAIKRTTLGEHKSRLANLERTLMDQLKRPDKIRSQTAEIYTLQTTIQNTQQAQLTAILNQQELEAKQLQTDISLRKLNTLLTQLNIEHTIHPFLEKSKKLQLTLLTLQHEKLIEDIEALNLILQTEKQQALENAQKNLLKAQQQAKNKPKVTQLTANKNIQFNKEIQQINQKIKHFEQQKKKLDTEFLILEKDYQSAEQKISLAGLSPALGNLLHEQSRVLPQRGNYKQLDKQIQLEMANANLQLFELRQKQESFLLQNQRLKNLISTELSKTDDKQSIHQYYDELKTLRQQQRELVSQLVNIYAEYTRLLADVDFSLKQLLSLSKNYKQFLNQRLLWVPSAPMIKPDYLFSIWNSIQWFLNKEQWRNIRQVFHTYQQNYPGLTISLTIICLVSFRMKPLFKRRLKQLLKRSEKLYADRFIYTFQGLCYIVLQIVPLILFPLLFAVLVKASEQSNAFSHMLADGLLTSSIPLFLIQFFYYVLKPKGLAVILFNWPDKNVKLLNSQLSWIRWIIVFCVFFIGMFNEEMFSEHSYTLGRTALIIATLAMVVMFHRFAHPGSGLAHQFYQENPNNWLTILRYVWYLLILLAPLNIIGFAVAGYYQSALALQGKLIILIRMFFFTSLFHAIIIRWLTLSNRRMALQNARQKRKQHEQAQADTDNVLKIEEALLDIPKINQQNRKLLSASILAILMVGIWLTFRDILPALNFFDEIILWHHTEMNDGQILQTPITLVNLMICLLYIFISMTLVKNFPGLVDVIFVGRYGMTKGSRYALVQLTRYSIIALSVILIAYELGGSWSKVQWLVAALSVGLGFGLQEIFANLISGIILLFERPIRVGDTVTIGDIHGKVSQIEMRATTIIDWDQKELIVPNKSFITDKLINWSLSDTVTRVIIPVGVSYQTDENQVIQLIETLFQESSWVLKEPKPQVLFIGFGDSSLDFSVRFYVCDPDNRLPAIDDMHRRIFKTFKAHQIEIPFPQRDVHLHNHQF